MKKVLIVVLACVMALSCVALAGCGEEVSGNCSSVVSQCQRFSKGDKVTVKVSGMVTDSSSPEKGYFTMTDSGSYSGKRVHVDLADASAGSHVYGSVTIRGELRPEHTGDDEIYVTKASLV